MLEQHHRFSTLSYEISRYFEKSDGHAQKSTNLRDQISATPFASLFLP